jgi:hypothetical protein
MRLHRANVLGIGAGALLGVGLLLSLAVVFAPVATGEGPEAEVTARLWTQERVGPDETVVFDWYHPTFDDEKGIGFIRTAVPMHAVGVLLAGAAVVLLALRREDTPWFGAMAGVTAAGLTLAGSFCLVGGVADVMDRTIGFSFGPGLYLMFAAAGMMGIGGTLGFFVQGRGASLDDVVRRLSQEST